MNKTGCIKLSLEVCPACRNPFKRRKWSRGSKLCPDCQTALVKSGVKVAPLLVKRLKHSRSLRGKGF